MPRAFSELSDTDRTGDTEFAIHIAATGMANNGISQPVRGLFQLCGHLLFTGVNGIHRMQPPLKPMQP
jgi:hypothetical protein